MNVIEYWKENWKNNIEHGVAQKFFFIVYKKKGKKIPCLIEVLCNIHFAVLTKMCTLTPLFLNPAPCRRSSEHRTHRRVPRTSLLLKGGCCVNRDAEKVLRTGCPGLPVNGHYTSLPLPDVYLSRASTFRLRRKRTWIKGCGEGESKALSRYELGEDRRSWDSKTELKFLFLGCPILARTKNCSEI